MPGSAINAQAVVQLCLSGKLQDRWSV